MSLYFRYLFLYFLLILSNPLVQSDQSHDFFIKFARVFSSYFQLWYAVNCRIDEIGRGEQSIKLMQSKCRDDQMNYAGIYLNVLNNEKKFEELLKTYDVAPEDYSQISDHVKVIEKSDAMKLIRLSRESSGLIDKISKVGTKANLEILRAVFPGDKINNVSDVDTNKLSADKRINIYLYYIDCGDDIQKDIDFCNTKAGQKFKKVFHDFLVELHKLVPESISRVSGAKESKCYLD